MSTRVDESTVIDYINQHVEAHGERPTHRAVAEHLGVSNRTVAVIVASNEPSLRGERRTDGLPPSPPLDGALEQIEAYVAEHGWAPSQRELAERLGVSVSTVNRTLRVLRSQGLIRLGEHPRQIQIVESNMRAPEETL